MFYYKGTGDLTSLTSWSSTRDGSGAAPSAFDSSSIFVIQGTLALGEGQSATVTSTWTGVSSGPAYLIVENGASLAAGINSPAFTSLTLESGAIYTTAATSYSNIGTSALHPDVNSIFEITGSAMVLDRAYGNLKYNSSNGSTGFDLMKGVGGSFTISQGSVSPLAGSGFAPHTWNITSDLNLSTGATLNLSGGSTGTATINIGGGLSNLGTISKASLNGSAIFNFNGTGLSNVTWGTNSGNFDVNIGSASSPKTINMNDSLNNGTGLVGIYGTLNLANGGKLNGSGAITVNNGGTLLFTGNMGNDRINNLAPMTLAGGTLNTGGNSETLGVLSLASDSTIDLGNGSSKLSFADSKSTTVGWSGILKIMDWSGEMGGGGMDQLVFANAGLTSSQLSEIRFVNPFGNGNDYTAIFLGNEVVPDSEVPEPATVFGGLALFGLIGFRERQRLWGFLRMWLSCSDNCRLIGG